MKALTGCVKRGCVAFAAVLLASPLSVCFPAESGDEALVKRADAAFGRLPEVMASPQNTITPEKVELGKILFFEPRISVDGTVSCSRCHLFGLYATDGLRKAIGNNCKENPRNAPTILNAASQISAHWIGNRKDVEDQARQSVTGPPSFGMPSNEAVVSALRGIKGYVLLFGRAFPRDEDPVSVENLASAVGAYERTLVTPAPFDGFLGGDAGALSESQKNGLRSFMEDGCGACHTGPFFGGQMYRKFGIVEPYWNATGSAKPDEGRFAVTKRETDRWVFKVPVLRNASMTAPYFHDGSVERLVEAVRIMGRVQLGKDLAKSELGDLLAFLGSLTGEMPESTRASPVLPAAGSE
jgi:cytochrome c peroxidase